MALRYRPAVPGFPIEDAGDGLVARAAAASARTMKASAHEVVEVVDPEAHIWIDEQNPAVLKLSVDVEALDYQEAGRIGRRLAYEAVDRVDGVHGGGSGSLV